MQQVQKPALGVALIILNRGKILIGQRLNEPMIGSWQLPGGWVFESETPEQAAQRQIDQFEGMCCSDMHCVSYTNNRFDDGQHSLSLYFQCQCINPQGFSLANNADCADWFWADWQQLPQPLFLPLHLLIESGFRPDLDLSEKNKCIAD